MYQGRTPRVSDSYLPVRTVTIGTDLRLTEQPKSLHLRTEEDTSFCHLYMFSLSLPQNNHFV